MRRPTQISLNLLSVFLLGALLPAAQAKRTMPESWVTTEPTRESIKAVPTDFPRARPYPSPTPRIDGEVQDIVRDALREYTPQYPAFEPEQHYDRVIELVFALDTTGSMSGLIDGAKAKVWRIINDVTQKQKQSGQKVLVRVGLVAYRDVGDEYVTRVTPLSANLDAMYSHLMSFRAEGGGDTPENVRVAMLDAVTNVGWANPRTSAVTRERIGKLSQVVFLVGDAPPHDDYRQWPSAQNSAYSARQNGIFVNTIQVGNQIPATERIWREIANKGGGEYFAIAQSGGVQTVVTPYDEPLSKLGDDISSKGLFYGHARVKAASDSAGYASSMAAAPLAAKADRAINKSINKESAYSSGDLVQAIENRAVKLEDIKTQDLPDEMQSMSASERERFIEIKINERAELRQKIDELSKKRDEYLRVHEAGAADAFDTAVGQALNRQIN